MRHKFSMRASNHYESGVALTSSPESNGSAIRAQGVIFELSQNDGALRVALSLALVNADIQPYHHLTDGNFLFIHDTSIISLTESSLHCFQDPLRSISIEVFEI